MVHHHLDDRMEMFAKKSKTNIKKYEALNYNPVGKIAKKTV